jgi:thiamine pyrophosphate-dependent acetolactate synthase large subunit-like protein
MKHLQILAQQIAERKVNHIFGIPGSGPSLVLLDALEKHDVRFHLTHFEGSAAIMAGAIGKLSGQSGIAISIKGPGLTNMLPGLAACALESFPVVSISEAYLPGTPPETSHKRIDHEKLLAAVVKFQCFLSEEVPRFENLSALAESEIPGVVHLNIAPSPSDAPISHILYSGEEFDQAIWQKAVDIVRRSKRPAVIAGTLAVRKHWSEKLNSLVLPVFSTTAAKGVVNETLPHAGGVFTGVGGPFSPEEKILPEADLVVAVGLRHNEVLAVKPFHCPAIQIDPLGEESSSGFEFDSTIEGTPSQVDTIVSALLEKQWGLNLLEKTHKKLKERLLTPSFLPAHIYWHIAKHFNGEARLVLDTGNFCTIGEHAWQVQRPNLYLASGQGRYMGVGIPLGIGAAFYDQDVPTIVFTGDGGIGMFVSEMKLAVQNKLPLMVVLLSDSFLGTIRGASLQRGLSQHPTIIDQPSWLKALEGLGVPGKQIRKIDKLEKALVEWKKDGPLFLEIPFDADDYQRMTEGIR